MDPLNPVEAPGSRTFIFDSAWMWPIVIIAVLFVGYLCFDALKGFLRNKRLNERREQARKHGASQ